MACWQRCHWSSALDAGGIGVVARFPRYAFGEDSGGLLRLQLFDVKSSHSNSSLCCASGYPHSYLGCNKVVVRVDVGCSKGSDIQNTGGMPCVDRNMINLADRFMIRGRQVPLWILRWGNRVLAIANIRPAAKNLALSPLPDVVSCIRPKMSSFPIFAHVSKAQDFLPIRLMLAAAYVSNKSASE